MAAAPMRSLNEKLPGGAGNSLGSLKSPWPPVCEIMAPDGQMRGPGTTPMSIARFRPSTGPPRSRTLVKPRNSMSLAPFTATAVTKARSAVSTASCVRVSNMMWVCASINPGISVRPSPAMRITAISGGAAIGAVEIVLMTLPTTSTFCGAERRSDAPLKMRTFSNSTAVGLGAWDWDWACVAGVVAQPMIASAASKTFDRSFMFFLACG
jgi:hypothetical protein